MTGQGLEPGAWPTLDCLQSAFSHEVRLVLISACAITNHDVIYVTIRDWDEKPLFITARGFAARVLKFHVQNKRLLAVYFDLCGSVKAN